MYDHLADEETKSQICKKKKRKEKKKSNLLWEK